MLSDEDINGVAFVLLTEDDLKGLGFTVGQRRIILESIKVFTLHYHACFAVVRMYTLTVHAAIANCQ